MILRIVNIVASLLPAVGEWVEALISLGHSPEEAGEIVRDNIESRLAQIQENRSERDDEFFRKHGEPFDLDEG